MGFSLFGKQPIAPEGQEFSASNWSWPSLWEVAKVVSPSVAKKVAKPYLNNGDGLDADDALALGTDILAHIEESHEEAFYYDGRSLPAKDAERFGRFLVASGGFEIY